MCVSMHLHLHYKHTNVHVSTCVTCTQHMMHASLQTHLGQVQQDADGELDELHVWQTAVAAEDEAVDDTHSVDLHQPLTAPPRQACGHVWDNRGVERGKKEHFTHTHTHTIMYARTHTCAHIHSHARAHTHTCARTHTHMHSHTYSHNHPLSLSHIQTSIHPSIHAHTHTYPNA